MAVTLTQLRYLAAVARHGGVSAAGKALNVSQPSVSTAIDQVEKRFGQKLFVRRRGSSVALTAFGHRAVAKARQVMAEADEFAALGGAGSQIGGELALGCFEDLAPHFAPALIRALSMRHPGIEVIVYEETFESLARRISDSAIDLALTYDLGLPVHATRVVLCELGPHALLAADHPLAARDSIGLADLAQHRLIVSDQPHSWQHTLDLFRSRGLSPAIANKTASLELQRSLVANGFGVAVSYTKPHTDRSYDGMRLVCRPISDPLPPQRIILAHDTRQRLSKAASAFIEEAGSWFSGRPAFSARGADASAR